MSQHLRHLTDWEPSIKAQVVLPAEGSESSKSYSVVIKRNDRLYKILSVAHTTILVAGVLLIAATFALVLVGMSTIMDAGAVLDQIKKQ